MGDLPQLTYAAALPAIEEAVAAGGFMITSRLDELHQRWRHRPRLRIDVKGPAAVGAPSEWEVACEKAGMKRYMPGQWSAELVDEGGNEAIHAGPMVRRAGG